MAPGELERETNCRMRKAGCINPRGRLKNVPQGLKPAVYAPFMARLKPCPFKTGFMQPVPGPESSGRTVGYHDAAIW
jgi:hypothetical protein